jgi:hypothetical protein
MKYIEHIIEPEKLLLSWQPPSGADRLRRIVAELRRRGDDADLVYLRQSDDYIDAMRHGFKEYPGFSADGDLKNVLPVFMKRLPPRSRRDFDAFLSAIRIKPGSRISDFALLGYAGGKLPGDDFYIIHPFDEARPPFEFLLPVAEYRYYQDAVPVGTIEVGMEARLELDPSNPRDPDAVRVVLPDVADSTAGYVCRGLLPQVRRWLRSGWGVRAAVERKNGASNAPMLYLYVTIRLPEQLDSLTDEKTAVAV